MTYLPPLHECSILYLYIYLYQQLSYATRLLFIILSLQLEELSVILVGKS